MGLPAHRRGVGKGLAGVRWLSEADCVGKRLSALGSSRSRTFGGHVLQGIVAVPLELVGCGRGAVGAGGKVESEGEAAEGGVFFACPWRARIMQASSQKAVSRRRCLLP